nr:ribosomal protein L6 [Rhizosolenia setigera]
MFVTKLFKFNIKNMNYKLKKINIPLNLKCLYNKKIECLVFFTSKKKKLLKISQKNLLIYKNFLLYNVDSNSRLIITDLKNFLFFKKITLVGLGFKSVLFETPDSNILKLQLGYSHSIYLKLPDNLNIKILKFNTLFISSTNLNILNFFVKLLKTFKIPDSYKGKGVVYEYEVINIKEGKKV